MKSILKTSYIHKIEILKSKSQSRNIESYSKNEYVNNVAVFPIAQNYELLVHEDDYEEALEIIKEAEETDNSIL